MKLNYTDGCICTSLTIDGVETIDMPIEELRQIVIDLFALERMKKSRNLREHIIDLIQSTSEKNEEIETEHKTFVALYENKINNTVYSVVNINYYEFILIDGKIWEDYEIDTKIFNDMCDLIKEVNDVAILQRIFCDCMEEYGEYHCSKRACECCGDYIRSYDMTI